MTRIVQGERPRHFQQAHGGTEWFGQAAATPSVLSHASTEELLLELRRRNIAPRDRCHETWDDWGGLDPHGDWPEQG
jgi:hypothetical protein